MNDLKKLKIEAKRLGLTFPNNITFAKLKDKIEAFVNKDDVIKTEIEEEQNVDKESSLDEIVEEVSDDDDDDDDYGSSFAGRVIKDSGYDTSVNTDKDKRLPKVLRVKAMAAESKKRALVMKVVTITDNDQRENNYTETVPVNCGNQYFDLGTRVFPLNKPIEIPQGFINVLSEINIPFHRENTKTGNCTTEMRKRYAVHYENQRVT